jgi:hypothetical protein
MRKILLCLGVVLGLSINTNAQNWNEIIKATASDAAAGDYFGCSVDISGDIAIIGAYSNDDVVSGSGSAYIFELDSNGTWSEVQKITASDAASGDAFGISVSISNNKAIIGSYKDDNGSNSGAAYIFEIDSNGIWSEVQKITASDGASMDYFGNSVSISGDYAIVGAQYADNTIGNSGSAYIFELDSNGIWSEVQKIIGTDNTGSNRFGCSVSINSNRLIVGAWRDFTLGFGARGAAYFYERVNGIWIENQKVIASDAASGNAFGFSVSLSDDKAIIGSPFSAAGSAYIFNLIGGVWVEAQKITASDAAIEDQFGFSVSISGNKIITGANQNDDNASNSGSAYIYDYDSINLWTESQKIMSSDADLDDEFGVSLAIEGNKIIAGVTNNDDDGLNSGSIYFFQDTIISTEVNEINKINNIIIYPNPTTGQINLELGDLKDVSIKVHSIDGQLIYSKENINEAVHVFDIREAAAGVYVVEVEAEEGKMHYKFVKQ